MPRVLTAFVALLLIALPSAAIAQTPRTNAPPGNSAIDEYLETVPGATGNQRPRTPSGDGSDATLTPAQRARLERLGPDGKALADAVDATAPTGGARTREPAEALETSQGRSPLGAVLDVVSGDDGGGGMGVVLPAILILTLLGAIVLVVARRRSAS